MTDLEAEVASAQSVDSAVDALDAYVAEFSRAMGDLAQLPTPGEDKHLLESMFRSSATYMAATEEAIRALIIGDSWAHNQAVSAARTAFDAMEGVARQYGLSSCPPESA